MSRNNLTFNKSLGGKQIAVVVDGTKIKPIFLHEQDIGSQGFSEYTAKGEEVIQRSIDPYTERQCEYVTGQSGSGKSFWTKQYVQEYHRLFPKRDVFIFSSLDSDPTLDKLKYIKRIKVNLPEFLEAPIGPAEFVDSLVVFDDVDVIRGPVGKKVQLLLDRILQTGRHHKVSVVYTSHTACNGLQTKQILNECHSLTIFPRAISGKAARYLFDNYLSLDKEEQKMIKAVPDRSVTYIKSYPSVLLSASRIWLK
jgi:hypothetical protein